MNEDRCVLCGRVIPEGTMVCPLCAEVEDNPVTSDFICEQLAKLFDDPCNFSLSEEEMHKTYDRTEWCEKHCGKATAAQCWMRYFQLKFKEIGGKGK